jgi:hypothetical protein
VLLHVLGHVEGDHRLLVAEEELGQRLGQLGLAHARGTQEDERPARPLGVLEPGPGAADGLGDGVDGVLLADDPLVELLLHPEQLLGLLLGQLVDRDAGPDREDLGDGLLVDLVEEVDPGLLDLGLLRLLLGEELLLLVAELAGGLEVLGLDGPLLLLHHRRQLVLELLVVRRGLHALDAQAASRLVDEVDGLVGEVPVGDVAIGQVGGRDERLVGDGDPVVGLVAVPQALEDLDGVGHGGLVDHDLLEASLQRRVLLEVLAVLVERGGAHGLQLAAGQHRLEDAGRVDGALGGAGADEGVQLVDEQDDVAPGADLLQHLLEALLEVAPVAGPGDQGTEVQRVELLAAQGLGHVVGHDLLGQALHDGGLAHTGLADEDRVVLGAPGQDLHDPLDLTRAADDGIDLLLPGQLGQVAAELVQHQRARGLLLGRAGPGGGAGLLLAAAGALVAGEQLDDLLADPGQVGAELHEHLGGDTLPLPDQAQQDVLRADVVVAQLQRLPQRELEDLLGPRREGDVPGRRAAALADDLLDLAAHGLEADPELLESLRGDALALVDQAQQDVLGADVVVVEEPSLLLGQHDDPAGPVGEPFEQGEPPTRVGGSVGRVYRPPPPSHAVVPPTPSAAEARSCVFR